MRPFRHQLAAFSPITLRSIAAAAFAGGGDTSRRQLADELNRDFGADEVVLVDSGTHALQLAIESALAGGKGERIVALPAFGCFDLATAVIPTGARVVFYDLDPATLSPDVDSFEQALEEGATTAVITPLYGMPVDWSAVQATARRFGVPLIEDAAQGHGAALNGKPLGSFGDFSVLSFSRGKGWTGGYGGALLVRARPHAATRALDKAPGRLGAALRLGAQWALGRPAVYGVPRSMPFLSLGETVFHPPSPVRLLGESAARALLEIRAAARAEAVARQHIAARYSTELADRRRVIKPVPGAAPGYLRFPLQLPGGMRSFSARIEAEQLGIAPSYPRLLQDLGALERLVVSRSTYLGAVELVRNLVTLPTHSRVNPADIEAIVTMIAQATRP